MYIKLLSTGACANITIREIMLINIISSASWTLQSSPLTMRTQHQTAKLGSDVLPTLDTVNGPLTCRVVAAAVNQPYHLQAVSRGRDTTDAVAVDSVGSLIKPWLHLPEYDRGRAEGRG